jgi:hypothetical protein
LRALQHYVFAKGLTITQVHGMGPSGIAYVNPADDPRSPAAGHPTSPAMFEEGRMHVCGSASSDPTFALIRMRRL